MAENGSNILSMQYDKIQQVSEDTVLSSYLAPQKEIKAPRMPEAIIYPFGLNQSQKLAVKRALSSKISIIQGPQRIMLRKSWRRKRLPFCPHSLEISPTSKNF